MATHTLTRLLPRLLSALLLPLLTILSTATAAHQPAPQPAVQPEAQPKPAPQPEPKADPKPAPKLEGGDEEPSALEPPADLPNTDPARQLRFVLELLNGTKKLDTAPDSTAVNSAKSRFTDRFLEDIPADKLVKELGRMHKKAFSSKSARAIEISEDTEHSITATITSAGPDGATAEERTYLSVFLVTEEDSGKIAGLIFAPAGNPQQQDPDAPGQQPQSWDDLDNKMQGMQGDISFGAFELIARDEELPNPNIATEPDKPTITVTRYRPVAVYEFGEDRRLAIGSTFKLYILAALAREVEAGRMNWTDELAIEDAKKSLPSGEMQDLPAGTKHPLEHFAEKMISISDNTATDHLLHHLTRTKVEAVFKELNSNPDKSLPFLSTREMFALKLGLKPALPPAAQPNPQPKPANNDANIEDQNQEDDQDEHPRFVLPLTETYIAAPLNAPAPENPNDNPNGNNPTTRASILTTIAQSPINADAAIKWTAPRYIREVEWFATARDCAKAMAELHTLEQRSPRLAPLSAILRKNPGLPAAELTPKGLPANTWKSIAYKGGSEPGVLNLTFLLTRSDDKVYCLSVGINDPSAPIDEAKVIDLVRNGASILARDGQTAPDADPDANADPAAE